MNQTAKKICIGTIAAGVCTGALAGILALSRISFCVEKIPLLNGYANVCFYDGNGDGTRDTTRVRQFLDEDKDGKIDWIETCYYDKNLDWTSCEGYNPLYGYSP